MKKIVLFVLIASLVAPSLLFLTAQPTFACGEEPPKTLLALVRNSSTIHVATFRGDERGERKKGEEETPDFIDIRRNFDVSTTLKGESVKFLAVPEREYIYESAPEGYETTEQLELAQGTATAKTEPADGKHSEEAASIEEEEMDGEEGSVELKAGDSVLLFLKPNEETRQIELTDYRDGLKKLSPAHIAIYEARIKEIIPMLAAKKPNSEKIVDWLVRLAEDPVTRWEGTYELEQSFNAIERKSAMDAESKEAPPDEAVDAEYRVSEISLETGNTTLFARNLNDYHKATLSRLLLDSKFRRAEKPAGSDTIETGDRELMSLVARWGDNRVAGMFLDQLRVGVHAAYDNSTLMTHIAVILDDKQLSEIAEKFGEHAYYDDADEVEPEEKPAAVKEPDTDDAPVPVEEKAEAVSAEKIEAVDTEKSDDKKKKKAVLTYKSLRADLIAKFLGRADFLIAQVQARAAK